MPRLKREDYPGAWHHVMNRCRNRERIYKHEDDVIEFFEVLGDTAEKFEIEVHAFSLMPNHYHLLVRSKHGNISEAMKYFGSLYTLRFNQMNRKDGALFRGRFKSQLVLHEPHLIYLLAYIHLNPLKANLVTKLDSEYALTSHRHYMGLEDNLEWLKTDFFLRQYKSGSELRSLVLGLHSKKVDWPNGMSSKDGWIPKQKNLVEEKKAKKAKHKVVKLKEILDNICLVTGANRKRLNQPVRGRGGNPERRFAVFALRETTLMTQSEIGKILKITPAHAAKVLSRMGKEEGPIEEWMDKWKEIYPSKVSNIKL